MVSLWYICDYCDVCDIYVTCDIYLNCLCQWNAKNKKKLQFRLICRVQWSWHSAKLGNFAECQDIALGKDFFFKKSKKSLPSAKLGRHSAKSFFKKIKNVFAECLAAVTLGKEFLKKIKNVFAECPNCRHSAKTQRRWRLLFFAERRRWPSKNALPSARQLALGKEPLCH